MEKFLVNERYASERLDMYVALNIQNMSRMTAKRLIEEGSITVNGNIAKVSYKVQIGDTVEVVKPKAKELNMKAENIPIDVVYEDNDIIVVNKPKGLVVHPANGNWTGTLVNAIMAICKDSLSGIGGEIRPGIVHRLDKNTSGLLIVAKNDVAHLNLSEQIKNRQVKKVYYALVRGIVSENEATINMPIGRSSKDRKKMAVTQNGKEAITHFKVIERFRNCTLLKVKIDTGRTHQIRVHLSEIGHPVIGDDVYSNGKNEFGVVGQLLHAKSLEFKHPVTGNRLYLEAELPNEFKKVLCNLRSN